MTDILINSRILRDSLTEHFHIDHVIDLKLISAVLLENDIGDPDDDYEMEVAAEFAKYFNKRWNLQIISRSENKAKSDAVTKYIRWKYNCQSYIPRDDVFDTIESIFNFYKENRCHILENIDDDEIGHRNKFREVERSLFRLLKCQHCRHPFINFDDIMEESRMLHHSISRLYSMDHIVELQIVAWVLTMNNIRNVDLAIKFANYFNEDWNFQIVEKRKNTSKGKNVHKWLKWNEDTNNYLPYHTSNTIDFIFNYYKNNRDNVIDDIKGDSTLKRGHRNLFFKMEEHLYDLLS